MKSNDMKTLALTLTKDQWFGLVKSVENQIDRIKADRYSNPEGYTKQWLATLESTYDALIKTINESRGN